MCFLKCYNFMVCFFLIKNTKSLVTTVLCNSKSDEKIIYTYLHSTLLSDGDILMGRRDMAPTFKVYSWKNIYLYACVIYLNGL